jgi:hypothetical protein
MLLKQVLFLLSHTFSTVPEFFNVRELQQVSFADLVSAGLQCWSSYRGKAGIRSNAELLWVKKMS